MQVFETYREFLESSYSSWVPAYDEPSQELLDSPVTLFAYTDYGGDFVDRVACEFLQEYAGDRCLWQDTCYFGCNLLYFGAQESDYILSDFEEFYFQKEYEAERKSFEFFVDDEFGSRKRLKQWALNKLMNERSGYYSPQPDGTVDFCSSELFEWLMSQPRH